MSRRSVQPSLLASQLPASTKHRQCNSEGAANPGHALLRGLLLLPQPLSPPPPVRPSPKRALLHHVKGVSRIPLAKHRLPCKELPVRHAASQPEQLLLRQIAQDGDL